MGVAIQTRTEEAYQVLKQVISGQEFPPGTWLRHREIATKLGMSRTPLLQAFQRLEHEGLVECVPQWGVRVRAITVKQLDEIFRMRLALETIVFRELASKAHELRDSLNKLRPLAEQVDREMEAIYEDVRLGRRTVGSGNQQDREFHKELARLSGLEMVPKEIDRLCLLSATIVVLVSNPAHGIPHTQLLDAILTGDCDEAERAIRSALEPVFQYDIPLLRQRFSDGPIIFDPKAKDSDESAM